LVGVDTVEPAQFVPLPKLTVSPDTGAPLAFLTVALTDEVLPPSAGILVGLAAPVIVFPVPLVCVIVVVALPAVPAGRPDPLSAALMVQNPLAVLEMYATATWPLELVVPVAVGLPFKLPHVPLSVKRTVSPETATPLGLVTVSVIVEVLVPFAAIVDGFATTALTFGTAVWGSVPVPAWPVAASVAVILHPTTASTVVPAV
jgi:hypothetical protein